MELQFEKQDISCLRRIAGETATGELTQELRLPEEMPDASCVVATWGQVLLRGKEWRSGGMNVSGGVMVWVLYGTEENEKLQCVDVWLPFQMKWDFPDPGRDGRICAWGYLQSVDARCASARKLVVRANASICGNAYIKDTLEIPQVGELPEDVQIQMPTYPMRFMQEAGEHGFSLEETLAVPQMDSCVHYSVEPMITEQRVMGDKLVFRGNAKVHMLYMKDEKMENWDGELPFSQFCDLEHNYEQEAEGYLVPAVTSMEIEKTQDGSYMLKCGITCQYMITDRKMLTLPEDSFSTKRALQMRQTELEIPCILQQHNHSLSINCALPCEGAQIIDGTVYVGAGTYNVEENSYIIPLRGQLLYADHQGKIRCESCNWEEKFPMAADDCVRPGMYEEIVDSHWSLSPDGGQFRGEMILKEMTDMLSSMEVVTGIELGEMEKKDPNRPSLILRRLGQESLWDVAKSCRTTVSAIQNANDLGDDCPQNKMLIIPIS